MVLVYNLNPFLKKQFTISLYTRLSKAFVLIQTQLLLLNNECLADLVPVITKTDSHSSSTGTVSHKFKQAVVTPLLKKH